MQNRLADPLALLSDIRALAVRAGAITLRYYHSGITVEQKNDASPVTAADREAEALILAELGQLTPDIPVVGEEAWADGHRVDISGGDFWLVDALDGTKEFVRQRGEYTVNVGLVRDRLPFLGVVHAPALGRTFYGCVGLGAWLMEHGGAPRPIQVRPRAHHHALNVVASKSHRTPDLQTYLDRLSTQQGGINEVSVGSSLKFALVAEGAADLYPRPGPTMEWDTCAGDALVRAAGGRVVQFDNLADEDRDLCYGKPDFKNGWFLVKSRV